MSRVQLAFGTAKAIYVEKRNAGVDPDALLNRVFQRLAAAYPDIDSYRLREIAILAMV